MTTTAIAPRKAVVVTEGGVDYLAIGGIDTEAQRSRWHRGDGGAHSADRREPCALDGSLRATSRITTLMAIRRVRRSVWVWACRCVRCGHRWDSMAAEAPARCAACGTRNFSR